jgi:hydroxymethylpyrimidine/phosphomethylpyrimidine kinase
MTPMARVLVVAGLDPSGGAGLVADLEGLAAVGAAGWTVAAALTAQGPAGVKGWSPVPEDLLLGQIDALLEGGEGEAVRPRAVKTGMLGTAGLAAALAARLSAPDLAKVPLVADPVLLSTSGTPLLDTGGISVSEALEPLLLRARPTCPSWPRSPGSTSPATRRPSRRRASSPPGRCW